MTPTTTPPVVAVLAELGFTFREDSSILIVGPSAAAAAEEVRSAGYTEVTVDDGSGRWSSDQFRAVLAVRPPHPEEIADLGEVASTIVVLGDRTHVDSVTAALEPGGFVRRATPTFDGPDLVGAVLRRMENQSTLHDFWRQEQPHGNTPQAYRGPVHRSRALHHLISDLPQDARILEVGCNVGRNLAFLHDQGYHHVEGIEISPHAVELLRETYPQLADRPIHVGPAGEILPGFADDSLDLAYTMAVIEHLHPVEAKPVFDAMVRTATHVVAIEPLNRLTHRQYPHDIVKEFTDRGMEHVSSTPMVEAMAHHGDYEAAMEAFTAYRFVRSAA